MTTLHQLTAHELLDLLTKNQISADEIQRSFADRIKATDPLVKAFVRLDGAASHKGQELSSPGFPLPIAIKDNLCIQGREVTCCSKVLTGFRPPYNATVVEKLLGEGAVICGQTNMDEFAFGSSTENSCFGPTRNPWDLNCVPGGSSGGSAAAVAADECVWALGSDTGGSIRQPASFCGVVGMKPTYGRVSRYGLIAFASSLDQIGPITKDVADAAILLGIIAGHDPRDSTSVDRPVPDYSQALGRDVAGLKIGLPKEYFVDGLDPDVKQALAEAIAVLKRSGAEFREVSLPHTSYCVATYYIIATAEASSNLARYDGVRYGLRCLPKTPRNNQIVDMFEETREQGFGNEVKRRVMLGTYSLSSGYYDAYYLRGQKARTLIKQDFDKVLAQCDAILTPTSPTPAFRIGAKMNDPLSMYLSDIFTISANLSGLPALSLPCGFARSGLPIGLQITAKAFDEEMLLRIGHHYEQQTAWHEQKPDISKA